MKINLLFGVKADIMRGMNHTEQLLAAATCAYEALEDHYDGAEDSRCDWMVEPLLALKNALDAVVRQKAEAAKVVGLNDSTHPTVARTEFRA